MPYCRNCGSKLDEDARFCRICGSPVAQTAPAPPAPSTGQMRKLGAYPVAVIVLVGILIVGAIVAALFFVPFRHVDVQRRYTVPDVQGINRLNLDFLADAADVKIVPAELDGELVRLDVSAVGSTGFLGSTEEPLLVTLSNETAGDVLTVTARVEREQVWPLSYNVRVSCNLSIDRSVLIDLNAETTVGEISLPFNTFDTTYAGVNLRSATGGIEAWLGPTVFADGNVSLRSTTGSIFLDWNNVETTGETGIDVTSTTGSISLDVSEDADLNGNILCEASTTTGSINCQVRTGDGIGFQVTSQTTTGSITAEGSNINGEKSPVYSDNYPADKNIVLTLASTTGSITVDGYFQPNALMGTPEQVRDDAMSYIAENHSETIQFMSDLKWTGGRVDPVGIGASKYTYLSGGWNVTITYPVVPSPIYSITADYTSTETGIPYRIIWTGTWHNGLIVETEYIFAQ